jgi:hypothetical protein
MAEYIVAGIYTFKRGHIWRIGPGSHVNIWDDHSIPSSNTRKVILARGQCLLRTVDELINPLSGHWDEELIRANFLVVDAERILCIPLSDHLTEDFVAWHFSKSYIFTVKSAYHLEWEHQFGATTRRCDGQGSSEVNPIWETLWNLQILSEVKIFMWRALHGIVPGKSILVDRHIKVQPQCPVCQKGPEDMKHLLFSCLRARQVWKELGLIDIVDEAVQIDYSGSVVLENLICSKRKKSPVLGHVGLKK